MKHIYI